MVAGSGEEKLLGPVQFKFVFEVKELPSKTKVSLEQVIFVNPFGKLKLGMVLYSAMKKFC